MKSLKFAVIGTGFWANYQIPAWFTVGGVELIALYNRTRARADAFARQFNVPNVYDSIDELLDHHAHELDFVDIITDVDTHLHFTRKAAERGLDVICQKPMGPSLHEARQMLEICQKAGTRLYIHENFRWQTPIRAVKTVLESGVIGRAFKARVSFCSAFPVFDNQPFLAELEQFILTDIGSHILDITRFLFGEAQSIYCQTARINPHIKGEDVANVLLRMKSGLSCYVEMSYASILEKEAFPQTLVSIEGSAGSLVLTNDYVLKTTTAAGTTTTTVPPSNYAWADPAYALVHSSIVACNQNLLADLQLQNRSLTGPAETTGSDNFETIRLVYAAYDSARRNEVVNLTN
ncbi:Gfo/Idh/MocA family protein [Spirosoma aerolatum]|uniref:Gfo/Idh/MocA family protein n=1 Tax=Spirosoma aerolatum TaxID=1211326 RepID=UPI0009AE22C9|nr:Gfo/Idh/MocA family oxidoreductase [Spirosoma aerolatum]